MICVLVEGVWMGYFYKGRPDYIRKSCKNRRSVCNYMKRPNRLVRGHLNRALLDNCPVIIELISSLKINRAWLHASRQQLVHESLVHRSCMRACRIHWIGRNRKSRLPICSSWSGVCCRVCRVVNARYSTRLLRGWRRSLIGSLDKTAALWWLEFSHTSEAGKSFGQMQVGRQQTTLHNLKHTRRLIHVCSNYIVVLQRRSRGRTRAVLLSDDPEVGLSYVRQNVFCTFQFAKFLIPHCMHHICGKYGPSMWIWILSFRSGSTLICRLWLSELLLHFCNLIVRRPVKEWRFGKIV